MMINVKDGQKDEVGLAYQILKNSGQAMYFRDLINEVVKIKGGAVSPHVLAEVHTRINMDSRFIHTGKGMWGLVDWSPQRSARYAEETAGTVESSGNLRREKLLAAIQQDYEVAVTEQEAVADDAAGGESDDEEDGHELEDGELFADLAEVSDLEEEDDRP